MGKKVISYCLFGNKLKYCHGIIEAVISSNLIFLDWEVRVYYSVGKQKVFPIVSLIFYKILTVH